MLFTCLAVMKSAENVLHNLMQTGNLILPLSIHRQQLKLT